MPEDAKEALKASIARYLELQKKLKRSEAETEAEIEQAAAEAAARSGQSLVPGPFGSSAPGALPKPF